MKLTSVSDGLPEKDGEYLCLIADTYYEILNFSTILYGQTGTFLRAFWKTEEIISGVAEYFLPLVTYWMPLPELPKGE